MDRVSEKDEEDSEKDEEENESDKDRESDDGPENDDGSSEFATGPGRITQQETEMCDEPSRLDREEVSPQPEGEDVIPQPIPFQMGTTPQDEIPPGDDLTDWYDDTSPSDARGSTDTSPVPKAKPNSRRERSPRNLRNRQVARSIKPEQRVHWNLRAQQREFEKTMTVEQMKMEWDLQETEYIQLNMDRQHAKMESYTKWHTKWEFIKRSCGSWYDRSVESHYPECKSSKKGDKEIKKGNSS